MPNDNQPRKGSPGRELAETQWHGDRGGECDPESPIIQCPTAVDRPGARPIGAGSPPTGVGSERVTDMNEFGRSLVEVGLIGADELAALVAGIPPSDGALGLGRVLQRAGKLTAYQAAAVHQRKSRGLQIGNYLILDRLGAGGMGVVFKARHRRLGVVVALKILPPSFGRDRSFVQRFMREVEAASRLQHPNIVAALDASEDRGVHFLVMEYVDGRDLDRVVRDRGPLPVDLAIDFLIQAARGLAAAHAQGIVHRDIKPANLMVDTAGTVRVLDLGLARLVDLSNPLGRTAVGRLTGTGMYMGSADYMAPEQAEDSRRADHRADIYSLGCSLHFLMTGREPFEGDTLMKRLMAHQNRPAPALCATRPDAPRALEDAFQKMMAKSPDDRPDSMAAVIALLESSKAAAPAVEAPRSPAKLMVFNEGARPKAAPAEPGGDSSIFAHLAAATDLIGSLRLEVEAVDPFGAVDDTDRPASVAAGSGRLAETPAHPARSDKGRGLVRLADPQPLCFDPERLHELWKAVQTVVPQKQGRPDAQPAAHHYVPVGPYRLCVVPSVRGRDTGRIAIQGLRDKQIELTIPAFWNKGEVDTPLLAIWVYSDHSLVIAYLDFRNTQRYVLWHAPKSHQLNYDTVVELNHELATLAMELPTRIDQALSSWPRTRKSV